MHAMDDSAGEMKVSDQRLRDLEIAFATLSATITSKLDSIASRIESVGLRHDDHESRLRQLEAKVWIASGAALAGGGILGSLGGFLLGS